MTIGQWIFGVGGGIILLAGVIYGFRQGFKVPPREPQSGGHDAVG